MKRIVAKTRLETPELRLSGASIAKQHKFYGEVQYRRYQKAVSASGIRSLVYAFKKGGKRCTCVPSASILNEQGEMSEEGISSIGRIVQNDWGPNKGAEYDAVDLALDVKRLDSDGSESAGDEGVDETSFFEEDLMADPDPFAGFGQTRCGICFGSGYVGGYDLGKGMRVVLDTQAEIDVLRGFEVSTSDNPNSFSLKENNGSVELSGRFPSTRRAMLTMFRVWNNDIPLKTDEYEWVNEDEFKNRRRDRLELNVSSTFTHIETQFRTGTSWVDLSQPEERFDAVLTGQYNTASFNVPADVAVNPMSIIKESKYNRTWQVVSTTAHRNGGITVFHESEARLVAQHELFHLLPGVRA